MVLPIQVPRKEKVTRFEFDTTYSLHCTDTSGKLPPGSVEIVFVDISEIG